MLQVRPHATSNSVSADAILKQMYRRYDTAATYDGTVATTIKASNGQSTTVIHAQAEGDRRGFVIKSRIEILTATGKVVTQLVRIDDGSNLWTVQPGSNRYRRDRRMVDRLLKLLRPFF